MSILHPSDRPEFTPQTGEEHWKLATVKHWYEDPVGIWTLKITDKDSQKVDVCIDFPFNTTIELDDGLLVDANCSSLASANFCVDGSLSEQDMADLDEQAQVEVLSSCCVCGGGDFIEGDDLLLDWSMIVYGHTRGEGDVPAVSKSGWP